MIYSHDEVELIDVLTLMEAVSKKAGSQITARMVADCHLAIKWFWELADFSGMNVVGPGKYSDWFWDGPVVMESLSSTKKGSLADRIYMAAERVSVSRKTVIAWINMHESWKVKTDG